MDYSDLKRELKAAGYTLALNGSGHYRVVDSQTGSVMGTLPCSPSDHRSLANNIAQLRAKGVDLTRRIGVQERRKAASATRKISDRNLEIIDLAQTQVITASTLVERYNVTDGNARQILGWLLQRGLLHKVARGQYAAPDYHQPAQPITAEKPSAPPSPLVWTTTPVPAPSPTMFELIGADTTGSIVIRDEDGNLWIAARLNTAFLALAKEHA